MIECLHLSPSEQVQAFAAKIFRRADGLDNVVPLDFSPDWGDRPAMFRSYCGAPRIALPGPMGLNDQYHRLHERAAGGGEVKLDIAALSTLLYLMSAPLRRKLDLSWNTQDPPTAFTQQEYRRGSASGGGLYPTQIYLVSGGGSVPAGLYHYGCGHHALVPLRRGDYRRFLASALTADGDGAPREDYFVLSIDFWQNCFKYHNFGYHACSQDIGAMLASAHLGAAAFGIEHEISLSFHDEAVEQLIGVRPEAEGCFAVIGLGGERQGELEKSLSGPIQPVAVPRQKSRAIRIPEELKAVHAMTRQVPEELPDGTAPRETVADELAENAFDSELLASLPEVLMRRHSAWGSMRGDPIPLGSLETLLRFLTRHREAGGGLRENLPDPADLQLVLQANSVAGLPRGGYRWDGAGDACEPIGSEPPGRWQSTYSMLNYNIDEAGCVLFITGNLPRLIKRYGARGYRVLNAHVGLQAQLAYVGAAALGLDCGVVLGVRAQRVKACMALDDGHEVLLAIYLGVAQSPIQLFDFRFIPGVSA